MADRHVESSELLTGDAVIGHDLIAGLKFLNAPVEIRLMNDLNIQTKHDQAPQQVVPARDLHQALRYGIPVNKVIEATTEIRNIMQWLDERFQ